MIDLARIEGFDRDAGNDRKNADRHGVTQAEAERIFLNEPLLMLTDHRHNTHEPRDHALGRTADGRRLPITFTLRGEGRLIRVISAVTCTAGGAPAMRKRPEPVPAFKIEAEERRFWETHDSADYLDWSKAAPVRLPALRPSTTAISLRLPVPLLERIKIAANKRDMPYQSLIKAWLAEKLDRAS